MPRRCKDAWDPAACRQAKFKQWDERYGTRIALAANIIIALGVPLGLVLAFVKG